MSFVFMAFHYPKPEYRDVLLRGMAELRPVMATVPGFIEGGPWREEGNERIVAISKWESKQAFLAAWPAIAAAIADVPFDEWEFREQELFHLEPAVISTS